MNITDQVREIIGWKLKKQFRKASSMVNITKIPQIPLYSLSKTFLSENFELIGEYKKIFGMKAGVLKDEFSYSTPNDLIK